jgi:hypothetical protein
MTRTSLATMKSKRRDQDLYRQHGIEIGSYDGISDNGQKSTTTLNNSASEYRVTGFTEHVRAGPVEQDPATETAGAQWFSPGPHRRHV